MNDVFNDEYLYTLHPDFELSNEWLVEVIKESYLGNDLLQEINNLLDEYKSEGITENDIDEYIKEELEYLYHQHKMEDITDEEYLKYKAEITNKKSSRKQLESDYLFGYLDALAIGEYLVALGGHPTMAFQTFLRNNAAEKAFEHLRYNNSLELFKNTLNSILCNIIPNVKKNHIIDFLGIFGEKNKQSWLKSVDDLDANIKNIMKEFWGYND